MSETSQSNKDNQEIDLSVISKGIGKFFERISSKIFRGVFFIRKNIIWIGALVLIGGGAGAYLDKKTKSFDNQIIVCPNFSSTDYLYAKINLINSKIEDNDTVFLRDVVGIKDAKKFKKIEIQPIPDIYKFIEDKDKNFDLLKLMAEDGDIKKIVTDNLTSKNYPFHLITFKTTKAVTDDRVIKPLLNYFNNTDYYVQIQKEYLNNIKIKMTENDSIISQINGFLNAFKNTTNGSQKSDKLVYYNENSQLNDVIKTKDELIKEQGSHRIELVNLDRVVKDNSITVNIKDEDLVNGNLKFTLPLLLVFCFILIRNFNSYYKRQVVKMNN
ncbi:hypothetical protein EZL74_01555 [Flavobacterium silvisoli]|uniref:Uncharacterized protein n=1 Tax=Flavobacterium silvisoli TaxID=2529433 RepID=A0A4Q9Z448_9FLAO|nr:hypothetical protein [Flavobacterium silvisoli]TBX71218.1 hypothetical protein EZL74_01555 [Flavobacterium silvisoli]